MKQHETCGVPGKSPFLTVLRRPVSALMLGLVFLELGLLALFRLPVSLLPEENPSAITVITDYPGKDPRTVERRITIPLERALSDLVGLQHITSESREGESRIHLFLDPVKALSRKINRASELIQPVSASFPGDVNRPYIVEYSKDDQPVFAFSLSSKDRDLSELRTFADQVIEPHFLQLEGVAEVPITGGTPREIQVIMDPGLFASRALSVPALIRSIASARARKLVDPAKGEALPVNIEATIPSLRALKRIPDPRLQKLQYSARVEDAHRPPESISRTDGRRRVTVYVKMAASASLLATTERTREALRSLELPTDIQSSITLNRGRAVRRSLESLVNACIQGTIIAIVVLLLFLRNLRLTILTALSIPFSVISLFAFLLLLGVGLNGMTFSALAMSVGLLVDNAILISERMWTQWEPAGLEATQIAPTLKRSAVELLGGTGTTIITFLPIAFLSGPTRERFMGFAITTSAALALSLFFALVLLPILVLKVGPEKNCLHPLPVPTGRRSCSRHGLFRAFRSGFHFCLRRKRTIVILNLIVLCLIPFLLWKAPAVSASGGEEKILHAQVSLPTGMHLQKASRVFGQLESMTKNRTGIDKVDAKIEKNRGDLYITLNPGFADKSEEIRSSLSHDLNKIPDAYIHFGESRTRKSYEMKIKFLGSDYATMKPVIQDFADRIRGLDGVTGVIFHFREPRQYIDFHPDLQVCSGGCPAPSALAQILRYNMTGAVIAKLHWDNRELDLRLKGRWEPNHGLQGLRNFPVSRSGGWTELASLGRIEESAGEAAIWRDNGRRALSLSVQMQSPMHREVLDFLDNFFRNQVQEPDLGYAPGRDYKEGRKHNHELMLSVGAACLLVFFLLAGLLESLWQPLAVLLTIPLPLGIALSLQLLIHSSLSEVSLFALMMLGGLTANGAIVMISTLAAESRNHSLPYPSFEGTDHRAWKHQIMMVASTRVRPILITSITTVCSMVPLLFTSGSGANLWQPVALITIAGTLASVPGVLFLAPLFFYMFTSPPANPGTHIHKPSKRGGNANVRKEVRSREKEDSRQAIPVGPQKKKNSSKSV
ncbi:MAG: efflux RND transporter permease subunit [Leptospiraceae bacterium]|nr:efflux RND transporter permease subunit [Leptospiraceae bacterium]